MKYCSDCKYYIGKHAIVHWLKIDPSALCRKTKERIVTEDAVFGKEIMYCCTRARYERNDSEGCGPEAINFKPSFRYHIILLYRRLFK